MYNLFLSEDRKKLAEQIKSDIDAWSVKEYTGDHRDHLGASVIGQECHRKIWYDFRWVKFEMFDGRMLRLFNRGHMEEELFVKWLRGIGCQVWEVDPQTNKQFRIWGCNGHYGGSADSVGILPYLPNMPILLEFKTHNTKSFVNLVNQGLRKAKPQHYSQMCSYGAHYNFKYGLYMAVNKNDDDIYPEIVELDWRMAHDIINKADDIINAKTPPPRIAENPAYFACKFCNKHGICWDNEKVEINCRSCRNAIPVENAEWKCLIHGMIPKDFIPKGCKDHVSIAGE